MHLDHEILDNTVENAVFVAESLAPRISSMKH
jgi:hypothetical protein